MPVADTSQLSFLLNMTDFMIFISRASESYSSGSTAPKGAKTWFWEDKKIKALKLFVAFQKVTIHKQIYNLSVALKLHGQQSD